MSSLIGAFVLVLFIDLALSLDNAGVNAAIVKSFPKQMRNKILLLGVVMAIVFRIILTFISGWLYGVPYLKFLGGLWVVLMGIKMFADEDEGEHISNTNKGLFIAGIMLGWTDLTMSMDNVLALIGAANGNVWMVVIGVVITIPILFLATKWIVTLLEKFPMLNFLFAGVLGFVGFKMMYEDLGNIQKLINFFVNLPSYWLGLIGVLVVLGIGIWVNVRESRARAEVAAAREQEEQ